VQLCREAEVRRVIAEIDATGRCPGRRQVQKRLPPGIYMRDVRLATLWRAEVIALGWPEGRYLKHRPAGVRRDPSPEAMVTAVAAAYADQGMAV
jgi:hypothetical protein